MLFCWQSVVSRLAHLSWNRSILSSHEHFDITSWGNNCSGSDWVTANWLFAHLNKSLFAYFNLSLFGYAFSISHHLFWFCLVFMIIFRWRIHKHDEITRLNYQSLGVFLLSCRDLLCARFCCFPDHVESGKCSP